VSKIEELEGKLRKFVDELLALRRENQRLKNESESLKSHVILLNSENSKAQRILAEYEQMKKKQEQVTHRVERALSALNQLRPS
jgi:hypothetical protein